MHLKRWVGHTRNEARNLQQIVNLGKVGIGESVSCEAPQQAARRKRTRSKHGLCDLAGRHVVPQKDDSLLRQERIDEYDDWMRVGPIRREMCMYRESLRRLHVRFREVLYKLDQGEVAHGLRRDRDGYLDRDRNALVQDPALELVRVPRHCKLRLTLDMSLRAGTEDPWTLRRTPTGIEWLARHAIPFLCNPHLNHLLKLLDEKILVVALLKQMTFQQT